MSVPRGVVLINGKRKCGKDYFAEKLNTQFIESSQILHLSEEIKREYAQLNGLDFQLLLTDSPYKDVYRREMIALGETRRNADPAHYCKLSTEQATKPIWIIPDNRRVTDIEYFKSSYPGRCLVVRLTASEDVRKQRGWSWKWGVDDAVSECGLDDFQSDYIVVNNGDEAEFGEVFSKITDWVNSKLA